MLRKLGASTGGLIMVGDGINDAPALAAATAGISLEVHSIWTLRLRIIYIYNMHILYTIYAYTIYM